MKLLFENWRKYINEQASEEEWAQLKQWKRGERGEEFKQARMDANIEHNCEAIRNMSHPHSNVLKRLKSSLKCKELLSATQGTEPGVGNDASVFKKNKIVKELGKGMFGQVFLLDNDHVLKIFVGGVRGDDSAAGLEDELAGYQQLRTGQFGGTALPIDMAVYEYGTFKANIAVTGGPGGGNWRDVLIGGEPDEAGTFGYAEVGKVQPFNDWIKESPGGSRPEELSDYFLYNILRGVRDAYEDGELPNISEVPSKKEYIDIIYNFLLEGGGRPSGRTGWAPWQGWEVEGPEEVDPLAQTGKPVGMGTSAAVADLEKAMAPTGQAPPGKPKKIKPKKLKKGVTPMPKYLMTPEGTRIVKSYLEGVYRLSVRHGDDKLFGMATFDVHPGNFGVSYQTGEVVIYDR